MMQDNDLISRSAAIFVSDSADYRGLTVEDVTKVTDVVSAGLRDLPAVDAVPVVRCRDCKYYNITCCSPGFGWCERSGHNHGTTDDWFCADGVMEHD